MESISILGNEERVRVETQLLEHGRAQLAKDPTAELYFAERARGNRDDVAGYAHLLNAIRLGAKNIPQQIVDEYRRAAENTPKEALKESYEGCLALGKAYFARNNPEDEKHGLFFMKLAADSPKDIYGVASRILADHLSTSPSNLELYMYYERKSRGCGNPDLLDVLCGRTATTHREEAV